MRGVPTLEGGYPVRRGVPSSEPPRSQAAEPEPASEHIYEYVRPKVFKVRLRRDYASKRFNTLHPPHNVSCTTSWASPADATRVTWRLRGPDAFVFFSISLIHTSIFFIAEVWVFFLWKCDFRAIWSKSQFGDIVPMFCKSDGAYFKK